jgi:hypothetical protein
VRRQKALELLPFLLPSPPLPASASPEYVQVMLRFIDKIVEDAKLRAEERGPPDAET